MGRSSLARIALVVCLAFIAMPGVAKTMKVTPERPVAIVDIPDDWEVVDTKRGFGVKSPDKEVYFWIETFTPDQRASVVEEHVRYFTRQGVQITGEPKVKTQSDQTLSVQETDFSATWKEKPTVLRYLVIDLHLPSQTQILLSYWASPDGDQEHDDEMSEIVGSFRQLAQ